MVLGETDVARAKPKSPARRKPTSANSNWDASLQPAAAANCLAGNQRSPLSRWTTSTRPGLHRASGDGGRRALRVGQTEGSVMLNFLHGHVII